jgi:serine/threonine-protein kinase
MTDPIRTNTLLNNRYQVQRELGHGGMGAVYLAQDLRNRRPVAIKVARLASPEAREQFRREADYLQKLHHHSLPRVWDFFSDTQRDFLVMEYIPGDDLETLVQRKGPQPEWLVLRWAEELLDGLAYLHTQNPPIIHRDIKPGNLKLRQDETLALVDFGIAKEYVPGVDTFAGATAVTPGFSPPEQYSDSLTDARSDLYSAGAAMYFLLTGVAPAPAPARASGDQKLLTPTQLAPSVSTGAEMVVRKALSLPRDQRWASAAEMAEMVDQAAQRLAVAQPPANKDLRRRQKVAAAPAPPARSAGRLPLLLVLLTAAVGVATIALFILAQPDSGPATQAAPEGVAVVATATPSPQATATPSREPPSVTATPSPVVVVDTTVAEGVATMDALLATPAQAPTAGGLITPTLAGGGGEATSTPFPTRTPTAAPPTRTPTPTARAATPGGAPAPGARATTPSAAGSVTVALLEPGEGDTRGGDATFRWNVTGGNLPASQAFEVFFYTLGQDPLRDGFGVAPPTPGNSVQVALAALDADPNLPLEPGVVFWGVRLVDRSTGRPVSLAADGRRLIYQRSQQPGAAPAPDTPAPPTSTPWPTDTPAPPTSTPWPTDTPAPPTNTPMPAPTEVGGEPATVTPEPGPTEVGGG